MQAQIVGDHLVGPEARIVQTVPEDGIRRGELDGKDAAGRHCPHDTVNVALVLVSLEAMR